MLTPRTSSGSQDVEREDLAAHALQVFRGVGEVVFALGVAGPDLVESVPEARQLEDVAARVDLLDSAFLGRAVAFLDDPEESAGRIAEDAAKTGGIVEHRGPEQAGRLVALLAVEQVGEWLGPEQRFVADEDQRGPFVVGEERSAGS